MKKLVGIIFNLLFKIATPGTGPRLRKIYYPTTKSLTTPRTQVQQSRRTSIAMYRCILGHQHTPPGHPDQNGSKYNVKMEWEVGEITHEPLSFLAKDT